MFLYQNSGRQRFRRIVFKYWYGSLNDDWTAIQLRGDKVHRYSTHPYPVLDCLTLRVQSRERRQQRGMDVENRIRELFDERGTDEPHESRKADEADVSRAQLPHQRAIVVVARRPAAMGEVDGLDAGRPRSIQARGIFTVGDDDHDRGIEAPVRDRIDECLKIAAAARYEDAESAVHCRLA